jgi:DNA invertase Pin-like site-specific DNA recombinase
MSHSAIEPTASYIYCRVSSARQNDRGLSLAEQQDRCSRYAAEHKWEVEKVVKEVGSAYKKELKKLNELIKEAKDGSVILITTYDRFSRNVLNGVTALNELAKRKIRILSVQEPVDTLTPAGRYSFQILVASGEFNSANTGFKVKATFDKLRREGNFLGPAAFGFSIEKEVDEGGRTRKRRRVVDEKESAIVSLVEGLRGGITAKKATALLYKAIPAANRKPIQFFSGEDEISSIDPKALQFGEIADLLNEYDVPYRNGKAWKGPTVKRIVDNSTRPLRELEESMSHM